MLEMNVNRDRFGTNKTLLYQVKVFGGIEVNLYVCRTMQEQTEKIRDKVAMQMKQKVNDEDDRLAKAVAEREAKIAKEKEAKLEKKLLSKNAIRQHRIDTVSMHCKEYCVNHSETLLSRKISFDC